MCVQVTHGRGGTTALFGRKPREAESGHQGQISLRRSKQGDG